MYIYGTVIDNWRGYACTSALVGEKEDTARVSKRVSVGSTRTLTTVELFKSNVSVL